MQREDSKEKREEGQGNEGDASQRWLSREVGWAGVEWVGVQHRKAIKDGSVTRHWQQVSVQKRDA